MVMTMPVVRADALCECEGCGKRFGVELDIGIDLKCGDNADFEALVRDTICGGNATCYIWGVRGKATVDRMSLSYQATIQAELMLCDVCSRKCDDLPIEGALTRAQVNMALNLPDETT
jgi:hypothetical protein